MNCPYCHHEIEEEKPNIDVTLIFIKGKAQKVVAQKTIGKRLISPKPNYRYCKAVPVYFVEQVEK